jgi:hypothetical protein
LTSRSLPPGSLTSGSLPPGSLPPGCLPNKKNFLTKI